MKKLKVGEKSGKLTAVTGAYKNGKQHYVQDCRCECGQMITRRAYDLAVGRVKSCGCISRGKKKGVQSVPNLSSQVVKIRKALDHAMTENTYLKRALSKIVKTYGVHTLAYNIAADTLHTIDLEMPLRSHTRDLHNGESSCE
jgi:hypothetical protein